MSLPQHDDYARLLGALGRIGSAETLDAFARTLCDELLVLVPGLHASYNEVDHADGRMFALIRPDLGDAWRARFESRFALHHHEHPLIATIRAGDDVPPTEWRDVDPDRAFESTPLYRDLYAPNGVRSQLTFTLPSDPGISIVLAINRDGSPFTARERALLDAVRPHLGNTYRLVRRLSGAHLLGGAERPVTDSSALQGLGLTRRQTQVLALVASGAANKQIATALGISHSTVRAHLERIFEHLGVNNRTAAATLALRPGSDQSGRPLARPPAARASRTSPT